MFSLSAPTCREGAPHNEHGSAKLEIKADYLGWEHLGSAPCFSLCLLPDQPDATKTGILRREKGGGGIPLGQLPRERLPLGKGKAGAAGIPGSQRVGMRSSFSLPTAGAHPGTHSIPTGTSQLLPPSQGSRTRTSLSWMVPHCDSCIQGVLFEIKAIFKVDLQV